MSWRMQQVCSKALINSQFALLSEKNTFDRTDVNASSISMKIKESKRTQIQGEGNSIQFLTKKLLET